MAETETETGHEPEHQGHEGTAGNEPEGTSKKAGAPGAGSPKDKKDERRKTTIIVVLTAVGVVIAFMTMKKSSASSAAANTNGASSATNPGSYPGNQGGGGIVAGSGGSTGDPYATAGLSQQLSDLTNNLTSFESTLTASLPTGTPTSGSSGTVAAAHSMTFVTGAGDTLSNILGSVYGATIPKGQGGNAINELKTANPEIAGKYGANNVIPAGTVLNVGPYYQPPTAKTAAK